MSDGLASSASMLLMRYCGLPEVEKWKVSNEGGNDLMFEA